MGTPYLGYSFSYGGGVAAGGTGQYGNPGLNGRAGPADTQFLCSGCGIPWSHHNKPQNKQPQ
jgi:hypothetical protein